MGKGGKGQEQMTGIKEKNSPAKYYQGEAENYHRTLLLQIPKTDSVT